MRITAASASKCPIRRRAGSIVFIAGMLSGPELLGGAEVSAGSFRNVVRSLIGRLRADRRLFAAQGRRSASCVFLVLVPQECLCGLT
jgi:hypothetical protein